MEFLHVRHATSFLNYGGLKILVDPCLAEKGTYPAIPMTPNQKRNPLVNLSTPLELLLNPDFILSTHTHNDHFDIKATELLNKELPILCQATDINKLKDYGFTHLFPVHPQIEYNGIQLTQVEAQHGTGATLKLMGHSSGYILSAKNEPTLYFLGDTIYIPSIKENIEKHHPDILIINAGSPTFINSDPIVMNLQDIEKTILINPSLTFVIVHLEAFNHCIETRNIIHSYFDDAYLQKVGVSHFLIPKDNELLLFK